jgi:hypothetical protein
MAARKKSSSKKAAGKKPAGWVDPKDPGFFWRSEYRGGSEYDFVRYPIRVAGPAGRALTNASGLRSQAEQRYQESMYRGEKGRYELRPTAPGEARGNKGNAGKRIAKYKARGGGGGAKKR